MFLRVVIGIVPFALALCAVYGTLLGRHDINYYLSRRPPEFVTAATLAGLIGLVLLVVVAWTIARWSFALPLVLFEGVSPRRAIGESAARSRGHRASIAIVLAAWAVTAVTLLYSTRFVVEALGRAVAPRFVGSLPLLLAFISILAVFWAALGLMAGIVNDALLALLLARLYRHAGAPREPQFPRAVGRVWRVRDLSPKFASAGAAIAVLALVGLALLVFHHGRTNQDVVVIAHRGASADAPENTLAAFRLAGEQKADFVELDVQESADGVVLVVHDSDLMKIGGAPQKIWETDAATLRTIDIGSHAGPQFAAERVPTLAEALLACKGKSHVIVELKSYGHDQHLEERVAAIVEAAGMENDCLFMSLDRRMVTRMKQLRPQWHTGLLVAKAFGDLDALPGDFLAVEARMATARFVRQAHRNGQQVYVWTVNDPAWMLAEMARGVDGLITDRPAIARRVVSRRAAASDAQRVLVALLVRLGARTEMLEHEDALRP
jgi:glycerophosphoryl diester phosphodiesterase